jgi:two-component system chemotaxis response regulator CheB
MSQRVSIATASSFLALVIRKTLARSRHLETSGDSRDAAAALVALREATTLVIVDADMLREGADGAILRNELAVRGGRTIVIDARGLGVPDEVAAAPSIVVISGRLRGELDLQTIETELRAAVGRALRPGRDLPAEAPIMSSLAWAERSDAILELIVLGVSTGGPTLLPRLLRDLTEPTIPVLIVQHMPATETAAFAARLCEESGLLVREIASGPLPTVGSIGLLRGGSDFRVARRGGALYLRDARIADNPFHPNIDAILTSAVAAGITVGAAILTGMGQDGAAGALAMAESGLPVIAQRPETCAVAGMPQAAIDNGAARWVQSPESIASTLNRWSKAARRGGFGEGAKFMP